MTHSTIVKSPRNHHSGAFNLLYALYKSNDIVRCTSKNSTLVSDEQMKLHDEIIDIINLQINIIVKEMYLRGMEDRESMLQIN